MDRHVNAIDLLTLASGLFVVQPTPPSFFRVGWERAGPLWISANPKDGELYLKQYSACGAWERSRLSAELCEDIVKDFQLSKGIYEEDVAVLKQHARDIVNSVVERIGDTDRNWFMYQIATDANDATSMIYIAMEFNENNDVFITKLRACGGYNSQVIYARAAMLNPAYEPYMNQSIH